MRQKTCLRVIDGGQDQTALPPQIEPGMMLVYQGRQYVVESARSIYLGNGTSLTEMQIRKGLQAGVITLNGESLRTRIERYLKPDKAQSRSALKLVKK